MPAAVAVTGVNNVVTPGPMISPRFCGVDRRRRAETRRAGRALATGACWLASFGFRADVFTCHDHDLSDGVSGGQTAAIVSPKFSLILGPWHKTEFYLNGGYGLYSNDVRGTVGPPTRSHRRTVWSRLVVARRLPAGEMARDATAPGCSGRAGSLADALVS